MVKRKRHNIVLLLLCCITFLIVGCQKEDDEPIYTDRKDINFLDLNGGVSMEDEKSSHQRDINGLSEIRSAMQQLMADESYAYITGTITYTGKEVSIMKGHISEGFSNKIGQNKTAESFLKEVCKNLDGEDAENYIYRINSRLGGADTQVIFEFLNEKATGYVISNEYGKEPLQ